MGGGIGYDFSPVPPEGVCDGRHILLNFSGVSPCSLACISPRPVARDAGEAPERWAANTGTASQAGATGGDRRRASTVASSRPALIVVAGLARLEYLVGVEAIVAAD